MSNSYAIMTAFAPKEELPERITSLHDCTYLFTPETGVGGHCHSRNWLSSLFGEVSARFGVPNLGYLTADAAVLGPPEIDAAITSIERLLKAISSAPASLLILTNQSDYISPAQIAQALSLPPQLPTPESGDNDFGFRDAIYMIAFLVAHLAILKRADEIDAYVVHAQTQ